MLHVITAPQQWDRVLAPGHSLFLAGGVTGCPPWQDEVIAKVDERLAWDEHLVLINPRRPNWDMEDKSAEEQQIRWEHHYLNTADHISFWFSNATICPITLYELGSWTMTAKDIIIGIEPGYARESDVRIQTALRRPDVNIVDNLDDLVLWMLP